MMGGGPGHGQGALATYGDEQGHFDTRLARRMLGYLRPYAAQLLAGAGLVLISTGMALLAPYLLKVAIDTFIAADNVAGLDRVVLLILGTYVVGGVAYGAQLYIMSWIGQRTLAAVRSQIFDQVQRLPLAYFDRHEAGDIMSRLVNDVDTLNRLLSLGLTSLANDLFTLIGVMVAMLALSAPLALLSLTVLPLMVLSMVIFALRARAAYRATRETIGAVSADLQESISSVRVIQSFARERTNQQRFGAVNRENRDANVGAAALSSAFLPTVDILGALGTAIVIGVGGYLTLRGQVTVGIIVAFLAYLPRLFWPIRDMSQIYASLLAALAAGERIFQILDEPVTIEDRPGALPLPRLLGRVELRHVHFAYNPGEPVLKDINLTVEPGQTLAIVGPTGAGKTTIASLIGRFYDPTSGQVLVDGHDLRDVQLATLRRQMGIVLQDTFLFSGTVADNIRYGRLEATEAEVVAAARLANADDLIRRLPQGYETPVMERGANLSQGQRQLIAFARALLADPRILILDEATASVDMITERLIQQALARLLQGRTSIVIAHRLSTIRNADRVIVVDGGRIVEEGTHDELMARRGLYYALTLRQAQAESEGTEGNEGTEGSAWERVGARRSSGELGGTRGSS